MSLTQAQITRLAKLTALQIDSTIEISSVLNAVDAIQDVDTTHISHSSRSGNPSLLLREDNIFEDNSMSGQLLQCSPQKVAAHQIVLAGIMHAE